MQKSGYSIYRCGTCDLRFVYPLPNSLENIYGEDYFAGAEDGFGYVDYDADKQPMVGAFKKYLQLIRRLRPGSKTLFDVGAATGFFLDVARQDGFDVSGVEISEYAAQKAREKGISVETGLLDTVDSSNAYDVITMLDLIEHVTDPLEILKKAHALLAPNGLIVINTPDAGSLYASMMGCRWHLIVPPEHLYYFNRKNIARILEQAGFRTRLITTIGKNFSVPYVLRTLHGWLGWNVFGSLADWSGHSFLKHISLPINLGDNMFVIAEKI
jgi:2-polyprenyl-3-methyl-5-hydroxy-6-metoxy-1,4-benzoquinol methylase